MGHYKYQHQFEREKGESKQHYRLRDEIRKLNNRLYRAEKAGIDVDPDLLNAILNDKRDKSMTVAAKRLKSFNRKKILEYQDSIIGEDSVIIDNLYKQFGEFDSNYDEKYHPSGGFYDELAKEVKPYKRGNADTLSEMLDYAIEDFGKRKVIENIKQNMYEINKAIDTALYLIYVRTSKKKAKVGQYAQEEDSDLIEMGKESTYEFARLISGNNGYSLQWSKFDEE